MTPAQRSVTGAYAVIVAMLAVKHNVFGAGGQLAKLFARPANPSEPPTLPASQVPANQRSALPPGAMTVNNPNYSSPT